MPSVLARTPYAVGFRSGKETFILVTLHVLYGESEEERVPEAIRRPLRGQNDTPISPSQPSIARNVTLGAVPICLPPREGCSDSPSTGVFPRPLLLMI